MSNILPPGLFYVFFATVITDCDITKCWKQKHTQIMKYDKRFTFQPFFLLL